jgi:hypothetical protein
VLKFNTMKKILTLVGVVSLVWCIVSPPLAEAAYYSTASHSIVATSGKKVANSGSFSPNNITVDQGDFITITFSVPATDLYCCGIQVKGDGGQFDTETIGLGSSKEVSFTASTSFGFTTYRPGTTIVKAHGTVTVIPTPPPPGAPTGVVATAVSTSQIKLTWNKANTATSYKIKRGDILVGTTSDLEFTDSSLSPTTAYSYVIIALNKGGDSGPSSSALAVTHAASLRRAPPRQVQPPRQPHCLLTSAVTMP